MACACGFEHTIALADDGTVHSFGRNKDGELGLGHDDRFTSNTNSKSSKNKYGCL